MNWNWLPWRRRPAAPVSPFGAEDVRRAESALAELREVTLIALRTELLLREHNRQLEEHRQQTEHDGHTHGTDVPT